MSPAQDKTFKNCIGMEFVLIPAGKFTSNWKAKNEFGQDVPQQRVVTISKPFYLGKYAVTQKQWVAVMGEGSNKSKFKGRTNPVENVSWNDAQKFIQTLNKMEGFLDRLYLNNMVLNKEGGNKYRLPTEAEWEHAARAGTETDWFFGNYERKDRKALEKALEQYAWYGNSKDSTHPVGQKSPNPWGLYDIYGNVWEWVEDWYGEFKAETVTDPTGPEEGSNRVYRGGSWNDGVGICRSASRGRCGPSYRDCDYFHPGSRNLSLGFRLACSPGH